MKDYIADKNMAELLNWVEFTHKFLKGRVYLDPAFCFRATFNHKQLSGKLSSRCWI